MQKIVIDTNVIVSSLIQKNYPFKIIDSLFIDDKFLLCLSEELLSEYHEVLSRPKFSKFPDFFTKAQSLLFFLELKAKKFTPRIPVDLISDKDDNMILELALECQADYIITGNVNDFTFSNFENTKILTPRDYWENYKPE
jgi:putative PIN family toxin of toxin-antitoxin system